MNKRLLGLLLSVLLASMCIGCGAENTTTDTVASATTEESTPTQTTEQSDAPAETAAPTPEATEEPTPEPTAEPTPEPTEAPTPEPTAEPTPEPTAEPAEVPTAEPTPEPAQETASNACPYPLWEVTDNGNSMSWYVTQPDPNWDAHQPTQKYMMDTIQSRATNGWYDQTEWTFIGNYDEGAVYRQTFSTLDYCPW